MHIDRSHKSWCVGSIIFTLLSLAIYVVYAATTPGGAKGDTWIGLAFGVLGFLMILFTGALGLRKKVLLARIGSLTWWMRGHLWLGLLSLPMVFFHAGFAFGGPMTTVLMVLLLVIVASGILGAAIQHAVPGVMTVQVREESTYEQMHRALGHLRREAFELVWGACGEPPGEDGEDKAIQAAIGESPKKPRPAETIKAGEVEGQEQFRQLYRDRILPYLRSPYLPGTTMSSSTSATLMFDAVIVGLDPKLHESLRAMAAICDETRQKIRQIRLHRIMHGWLLFHIPLSMALMILMVVHAVMALYY